MPNENVLITSATSTRSVFSMKTGRPSVPARVTARTRADTRPSVKFVVPTGRHIATTANSNTTPARTITTSLSPTTGSVKAMVRL